MEKGGWLGHGGRTAPSAATKEIDWRITGQENRVERKETGSRQHGVIDNGDCRLAMCKNVRFTFVQRSFYDYDCDTSINGQL